MFLLCFTGSDTDPSVNKSFTLAYRLCSDTGLFPHFPPTVCPPPLQLHCTLMFTEPLQGCDVQVRSRPPTSCRAEVDSGYIFLCLMFCFLSFKPVLWNINNVTTQNFPHKQKAFMCLLNLQQTGVQLDQRPSAANLSHLSMSPCHLSLDSLQTAVLSPLVVTYRGTVTVENSA